MSEEQKKVYRLTEFAQMVGVYRDTVRNWQKRGILPDRRNPVNNYRVFTDEDVAVAREIVGGKVVEKRV